MKHTPSPQSVVTVEVSGLTGSGKSAVMGEIEIALKALGLTVEHDAAFQAEKNGTHADWQEALDLYRPTVVLTERNVSRAPAPSSLAGGEVSPLVRRMAYGYAIMHTTICHMAGTSGASGRWYYDKANEAFSRVSPIHSITEESNPHVNGDYFSGLSNFLAALSPEAPAREGVTHPDAQPFERFPELALHIERMAMTGLVGSGISWDAFLRELNAALTPADPCASHRSMGFHIDPCCPHCEAPAEGAGEIALAARALLDACYKADENSDLSDFVDGMLLTRLDKALRAPEAREGEAIGWTGSGSIDALKAGSSGHVWPMKAAAHPVPLYTRPAAPSADKLRIAVEALEKISTGTYEQGRARTIARQALAALKAK